MHKYEEGQEGPNGESVFFYCAESEPPITQTELPDLSAAKNFHKLKSKSGRSYWREQKDDKVCSVHVCVCALSCFILFYFPQIRFPMTGCIFPAGAYLLFQQEN